MSVLVPRLRFGYLFNPEVSTKPGLVAMELIDRCLVITIKLESIIVRYPDIQVLFARQLKR
jgi:hypothetical protein